MLARLETVRFHHVKPIQSLALSPDRKFLALSGEDTVSRVWDLAANKEACMLSGHEVRPLAFAFSADGKTVATGARDNTVRLWEVSTGRQLFKLLHREPPPDGRRFASNVTAVAFSPDGKSLVSAGYCEVVVWDVVNGQRLRSFDSDDSTSLAISSDGVKLALGGSTSLELFTVEGLKLWKADLRKFPRLPAEPQGRALSVVFSPDGLTLALAADDRTICLWDVASGRLLTTLTGHTNRIHTLEFSPDGTVLASGGQDRTVRLWEVASGQELCKYSGHWGRVAAVAFSADGKQLISASTDKSVASWPSPGWHADGRPRALPLSREDLEALWSGLESVDAAQAYQAMGTLVVAGPEPVAFIQQKLKSFPSAERIARLIADLDSNQFAVRQKASAELENLGDWAEPALKKLLAGKPSLEVSRRAEELLEKLDQHVPAPRLLRMVRTVQVLERIGTHEAKQVLQAMIMEEGSIRLNREAKAALDRLVKRAAATP
jgi:WD40 repeat protein